MADTTDEWIRNRTGIKERRVAGEDEATSDLAFEAGRRALSDACIEPDEVDVIIVATATPDMLFPSTACLVQHKLGLKNACAFDIGAACSGFIYALSIAESGIQSGLYETALVIGAESMSRVTDWKDKNTRALLGDGAGAVALKEVKDGKGILSFYLGADGSGADLLKQPAGGSRLPASHETINQRLHYLKMNGREVFKFATRRMVKAAIKALDKAGLTEKDIDLLIPHQANLRILDCVAEKLDLPIAKIMINVDRYGNTSAASIPIALAEAVKQKRINENDLLVLVAFGAGLTWGASVIRW
jgi:3-oxoacyl-[acyl-carrier-protein] synthase-3